MKKILYFIPLLIFLFIISPNKTYARQYYSNLNLVESEITDEQKQEYVDLMINSEQFKTLSQQYPYYLIGFNGQNKRLFFTNYKNMIHAVFYSSLPTITTNKSNGEITEINFSSYDTSISYNLTYGNFTELGTGIGKIRLTDMYEQITLENDDYLSMYNFYLNYVLVTNIEFKFPQETSIYDYNRNVIKTFNVDDNVFDNLNLKPEEKFTIESISNADNSLYNLSVELLGDFPEEFTFLYSICQLFLGLVIILVVLSPIILLLRLFR